MDNVPARAQLDFGQWVLIVTGIAAVVIPWWFGLLWMVGMV